MTPDSKETNLLAAGDVFAQKYKIIEQCTPVTIGQAYKAKDIETRTSVIVKILHCDKPIDPAEKTRFNHATGIACSLEHPNIVPLHDAGILDNKTFYVVEDSLAGEATLTEIIKYQSKFYWMNGVPFIFRHVAEALDHAHKNGLIHRNLNPDNIIVTEGDWAATVTQIANCSIAPFIEVLPNEKTSFGEKQIFSDPAYMSPEQCRGLKLDPASDIYSLGCIMYQCFCGVPPLKGNNYLETLYMQVNTHPLPISQVSSIDVPPNLATIILSTLEKEPKKRIQSAEQLLAQFEYFEQQEKKEASKPLWLQQLNLLFGH